MKLELFAIEDIHPYEANPRYIEQAIPLVTNSIREFGFRNPIIIDREHVIISGHARYAAARELGLKTVPCIVSEMSPEQARAFRIADNKTGEYATWDFSKLDEELAKVEDIDMEALFSFFSNDSVDYASCFSETSSKEPKEKEEEFLPCPHCGHLNRKP